MKIKAFSFYTKSADRKDAEAIYRLGLLYEQNIFSDLEEESQNHLEKAIEMFEQASELGHLNAMTDLGYLFNYGVRNQDREYILPPDLEKAIKYYTKAKKKRFPRALNNLGKLYIENAGLKEKIVGDNGRKGIKYLEMAASFGNVSAVFNLGRNSITP